MFDATPREWRLYVDDMIGFVEKISERSLDEAQRNPGPWQRIHRLPLIPA